MSADTNPVTRLLMVVTTDPMRSGRLAEAIRLAAGVSAWQKVTVTLFVGGDAVRGLMPGAGQFVDEDNIVEFLPTLAEHGQELYVEAGHPELVRHRAELPFPELSLEGLAKLSATQDYVMHF